MEGTPKWKGKVAKVSFGSGILNIEYDNEKLQEDKIKQMIAQFNVGVGAVLPAKVSEEKSTGFVA